MFSKINKYIIHNLYYSILIKTLVHVIKFFSYFSTGISPHFLEVSFARVIFVLISGTTLSVSLIFYDHIINKFFFIFIFLRALNWRESKLWLCRVYAQFAVSISIFMSLNLHQNIIIYNKRFTRMCVFYTAVDFRSFPVVNAC